MSEKYNQPQKWTRADELHARRVRLGEIQEEKVFNKKRYAVISLIVLAAVSVVLGIKPTIYLLQAPIALILVLILSYGCGMILATIGVFFRDMEYLWSVVLMIIMYTCAIFYYPEKLLKSGWFWILKYNPMFCIIDLARSGILNYSVTWWNLLYPMIFGLVTLLIGIVFFRKKQDEFILHI